MTVTESANEIDVTVAGGGGSLWEIGGDPSVLTQKTPLTVNNFLWQSNNAGIPNDIVVNPSVGSAHNAILGGSEHLIEEANDSNAILGGYGGYIANGTPASAVCSDNLVAGGSSGVITASGTTTSCLRNSVIGGQASFINVAGTGAAVRYSTVAGAFGSSILTTGVSTAALQHCSIFGGYTNIIQSTGATAPTYCCLFGGYQNTLSDNCTNSNILGGRGFTITNLNGCVMIGDHNNNVLAASVANEYTSRFSGGYRVYSNATATTGMTMAAGGSSWAAVSDINKKENLQEVCYLDCLEGIANLPVYTYNFIGHTPRCIGPTAQDWNRIFPSTKDPLSIDQQDAIGISLAGIQGLVVWMKDLESRINKLEGKR